METGACTAILAHGAGSSSAFITAAFPPDSLGVRACVAVDDRTGTIAGVVGALRDAVRAVGGPLILGGVSLGAHAAARLLADPPEGVAAGLLCMPAWTGAPDRVAAMTGASAEALRILGRDGVLAELDPSDWVTPQLAQAWAERDEDELVAEMSRAARQPGPGTAELRAIRLPVAVVALADDPLHPETVARQWARSMRKSKIEVIPRSAPTGDVTVFADAARRALRRL